MLPRAARLTSGESFRRCLRAGRKAGSRTLVVHALRVEAMDEPEADAGADHRADHGADHRAGPRVGFVVSRAVGGAVLRNRVRRRLRHLVRERLDGLDGSAGLGLTGLTLVVVRANPAAAQASYAELRADLARCLDRVAISAALPSTSRPS